MQKRLIWFALRVPRGELRPKSFSLHKTRDGTAFGFVAAALGQLGYTLGPAIFNFPESPIALPGWLCRGDLILMTTRPPLDRDKHKKLIETSGSTLEHAIFVRLHECFTHCSRSRVTVSDRAASILRKQKKEEWASARFEVNAGASLVQNNRAPNSAPSQLGYLVYVPALWKGGPRFLAIFGIGGTETLLWSYLLSTKYRKVLSAALAKRETSLVIGRFQTVLSPYTTPADLAFADKYVVQFADCAFI